MLNGRGDMRYVYACFLCAKRLIDTSVFYLPNPNFFLPLSAYVVACLKGEQKVRRPWWAPACLSTVFLKVAKSNRQSRVVSLKLEP